MIDVDAMDVDADIGSIDQAARDKIMMTTAQAQAQAQGKRRKIRHGNPNADGYDLHSVILSEMIKIRGGDAFTPHEVFGKYLDLADVHSGLSGTLRIELAKKAAANAAAISSGKEADGASEKEADDSPEEKKDDETAAAAEAAAAASFPHVDFLSLLTKPLSAVLPEPTKLNNRKAYVRFLSATYDYLFGFINRTVPLLNVEKEVVRPALEEFETTWRNTGGSYGWEDREAERILAAAPAVTAAAAAAGEEQAEQSSPSDGKTTSTSEGASQPPPPPAAAAGIDLVPYSTPQELCDAVDADALKAELSRIGLKCGGAPLDRAKRLFLTKDTDLADLPKKVWAKGRGPPPSSAPAAAAAPASASSDAKESEGNKRKREGTARTTSLTSTYLAGSSRRIDVARLEAATQSLIDQLRPTLDATVRRAERRLYQTPNERDVELDEEINGVAGVRPKSKDEKRDRGEGGDDSDEDSDEEDAPIYNPKGVPLGWDGKPIPYWLFKLHGLNHFYSCEICGNESYRGRHNFEKHFQDSKHSYGMRCLGIPNTRHFHGVTKIEDAQNLWNKLQHAVEDSAFDGEKEEEYEDSHGNVLTRKTYEDLARQGLL